MPVMKGLLAPQNTFLDAIVNHFDGTREYPSRGRILRLADVCCYDFLIVVIVTGSGEALHLLSYSHGYI